MKSWLDFVKKRHGCMAVTVSPARPVLGFSLSNHSLYPYKTQEILLLRLLSILNLHKFL